MTHLSPRYRMRLARETVDAEYPKIEDSGDVAGLLHRILDDSDREEFVVVALDAKNRVIGTCSVHTGTVCQAVVRAADVFKFAVLCNATAIIVAHNHPSGDTTPSPEDLKLTKHLAKAGEVMGIALLDHLIVGFREHRSLCREFPDLFRY
jgi:DNA repair protein RadC